MSTAIIPTAYPIDEQFGDAPVQSFSLYGGKVNLKYDDENHQYFTDGPHGRIIAPNASSIVGVMDKSNVLINWAVRLTIQSLEKSFGLTDADGLPLPYHGPNVFTRAQIEAYLETARKAHRAAKTKAGNIGKMAHACLDAYGKMRIKRMNHFEAVSRIILPSNQAAANCVRNAWAWIQEHHVEIIDTERKLYSMNDNIAGTMDWLGWVDGCLSILDFKSSNGLYDEYRLQTALYKSMYEEETGRKVEQRILLRLGKDDGVFDPHIFNDEDEYISDLMAAKACLILYDRMSELKEQARERRAEEKRKAKSTK